MLKKEYVRMTCGAVPIGGNGPILAKSVVNNSMVSSVGQEIGTEETFIESDFVNTTWETGTE